MPGKNNKTELAVIANDVKYIKEDVKEIKRKLESDYVSRHEFEPIKKIVYGLVSILLMGVVGALIKLVVIG